MEGDDDEVAASFNSFWGRLTLVSGEPPLSAMSVLLHEAKHADGVGHVDCKNGEKRCDADEAGAYGTTIAMLQSIETDYPYLQDRIDEDVAWSESRVVRD